MAVENILTQPYLGSTIQQYLVYFGIVATGVIAGKIVNHLYHRHVRHRAEATENRLDDIILETLGKPVLFLGLIAGAVIGKPVLTPDARLAPFFSGLVDVLVFVAIAWVGLRFTRSVIDVYLQKYASRSESKLDDALIPILNKIVNVAAIVLTSIVILDSFGYNVNAIIASLGIGGLAVAFAARETIADMFGGFNILTARPFVVDDRIEIGDTRGKVEQIGLRYTRLRDFDGRLITIPNSTVASEDIKNITSEPTRRVITYIGLVYDTSPGEMQKAIDISRETINSVEGVDGEQTKVWFWEYGDSAMTLRLQYYIDDLEQPWQVKSDVNQAIQEAYKENGFEMAFPTREIHLKKD